MDYTFFPANEPVVWEDAVTTLLPLELRDRAAKGREWNSGWQPGVFLRLAMGEKGEMVHVPQVVRVRVRNWTS